MKIFKITIYASLVLLLGMAVFPGIAAAGTLQKPVNILNLQNGIVGWYTFDGRDMPNGLVSDRSGQGNNASATGMSTSTMYTVGKMAQGLNFNFGGYVDAGDRASLRVTTLTISAWVKLNRKPGAQACIASKYSWGYRFCIDFNGYLQADVYSSSNTSLTGTTNIVDNEWHHVAWTFTPNTTNGSTVYIDGAPHKSVNSNVGDGGTGIRLKIGQSTVTANQFFGLLDDVRIYNRTLSATEINQLYEISSPSRQNVSMIGPANFLNGLAGWWTFDGRDALSGLIVDRSGNSGNGTIVNMATSTAFASGKMGQAFSFKDGQYVDAQNGSSLNLTTAGTVAFWAKTTSAANDPVVCKQDYNSRVNGYCADLSAGKYQLTIADGSNSANIISDQTWNDGSWHQVVSTWDGDFLKLYVDGVSAASAVANGSSLPGMSAYQGVLIKPAAPGVQQITGVGFKPKVIIFLSNGATSDATTRYPQISLGTVASTSDTAAGTQSAAASIDNPSTYQKYQSDTSAIVLMDETNALSADATLVSMDDNGFTLNWVTANASSSVVSYLALGGTDITDAKVVAITTPTATGLQTVSDVGFQGDFLFTFSVSSAASSPLKTTLHQITWGFVTRAATTTQVTVGQGENSGAGRIQVGKIHASINGSTATLQEATLESFTSDGFTLDWTKATTPARRMYALVIKGGNYKTGTFNQNTSVGTQAITGVGFEPVGLFMTSQNEVTGTAVSSGLRATIGMTSGTSNQSMIWTGSVAVSTYSTNLDRTHLMKVMTNTGNAAASTQTVMDLSSFDSGGFTVNNTTVDATSREMAYAAFGPTSQSAGEAISAVSNVWNLNFGRNPDSGAKSYYSGLLDDVRIYNRALSATEVANLHKVGVAKQNTSNVGSPSLTDGLLGWWTFDGSDLYENVNDRSSQNTDGYMQGFTSTSTATAMGKIGQALRFDGNDSITFNTVPGASSAPTLIDVQSSDWSDTAAGEATASMTWQAGDVFVVVGGTQDGTGGLQNPTATGLTFSAPLTSVNEGDTTDTVNYVWVTTAAGAGSSAISASPSDAESKFMRGITAYQYRGSNGATNTNTLDASAAKVISLVRANDNSAVVTILGDKNFVNDVAVTPDPASGGTVDVATRVNLRATFFVAHWTDQGVAGTTSYGITDHTGTVDMSGVAVEVKGSTSAETGGISSVKSVAFWAKPSSLTTGVIKLDSTKNIDISAGTVRGNNMTGVTVYVDGVQTTTFPDTNKWHHVVVTATSAVDAVSFTIGTSGSSYYVGLLDDVRAYNKTLSAAEVRELYSIGR